MQREEVALVPAVAVDDGSERLKKAFVMECSLCASS